MVTDDPTRVVKVDPKCTCQWDRSPVRGYLDMKYANPKCRVHMVVLRRVTMTVKGGKDV